MNAKKATHVNSEDRASRGDIPSPSVLVYQTPAADLQPAKEKVCPGGLQVDTLAILVAFFSGCTSFSCLLCLRQNVVLVCTFSTRAAAEPPGEPHAGAPSSTCSRGSGPRRAPSGSGRSARTPQGRPHPWRFCERRARMQWDRWAQARAHGAAYRGA